MTLDNSAITIRLAYADDEVPLERLAQLDSARVPSRPLLLAEVDGQLRAALSLEDDTVIADPFSHTQHLVSLLRARASADAVPGRRYLALRFRPRLASA
jgi:hypothetical protein